MISLQKIIKTMKTQPKTPKKKGEIIDLQISPPEIPPKKREKNKRSSDIFFRGSNRRSIKRKPVSAKENYTEIDRTGPPNQRPKTLTNQKSPTRNLQR